MARRKLLYKRKMIRDNGSVVHKVINPFAFWWVKGSGAGKHTTGDYATRYVVDGAGMPQGADPSLYAVNRALEKLHSKVVTAESQLGAGLGELSETLDMVAARARMLRLSFKAFRKGRFKEALKVLHVNADVPNRHPGASLRMRTKFAAGDIGGAWLEYWFGWAPTIGDLQSAVSIIAGEHPLQKGKIFGRGQSTDSYDVRNPRFGPKNDYHRYKGRVKVRVHVQAEIAISSRGKALGNQLGLTNLGAIGWELLPFSWLVDWFGNIGTYLESNSWWDGVVLNDPFVTELREGEAHFISVQPSVTKVWLDDKSFSCKRRLGMPAYRLAPFRMPLRLSVTRAATAISLLFGEFSKVTGPGAFHKIR